MRAGAQNRLADFMIADVVNERRLADFMIADVVNERRPAGIMIADIIKAQTVTEAGWSAPRQLIFMFGIWHLANDSQCFLLCLRRRQLIFMCWKSPEIVSRRRLKQKSLGRLKRKPLVSVLREVVDSMETLKTICT